jgi:hypothetical protein
MYAQTNVGLLCCVSSGSNVVYPKAWCGGLGNTLIGPIAIKRHLTGTEIFCPMNYICIYKMYLLQHKDECSYIITRHLHILAER